MASFKSYFKREISKSLAWLIVFGTAVFLLGGAVSYYVYAAPTKYDLTVKEPTKVASKAAHIVTTTPVADPTLGWGTYENSDYGFSFKYPSEWGATKVESTSEPALGELSNSLMLKVLFLDPANAKQIDCANNEFQNWKDLSPTQTECQSVLSNLTADQKANLTGPRSPKSIFVRVYRKNDTSVSLSSWLTNTFKKDNSELSNYTVGKEISLDGIKGYYSSIGCCGAVDRSYVIEKGNYIYSLGTNNFANDIRETEMPAEFTQIASTFKLLDITANWKTYENKSLGFSINYPNDLSYELSNNDKTVSFQSSQDKAQYADCVKTQVVECIKSSRLTIVANQGGENSSLSLDQLIQKRINDADLAKDTQKTTLGGQPAYDAISVGMFSSYAIVSKTDSHIYDLTVGFNCKDDIQTLDSCKKDETDTQKLMLSTFKFL